MLPLACIFRTTTQFRKISLQHNVNVVVQENCVRWRACCYMRMYKISTAIFTLHVRYILRVLQYRNERYGSYIWMTQNCYIRNLSSTTVVSGTGTMSFLKSSSFTPHVEDQKLVPKLEWGILFGFLVPNYRYQVMVATSGFTSIIWLSYFVC